jgi:putative transposase
MLLYLRMTYYKRNLPHWHPPGRAIFITWRLAGTLPQVLLANMKSSNEPANRKFAIADRILDCADVGPRWLAHREVAEALRGTILKSACELRQYHLIAYVIMPNQVHILIEPLLPLERITRGIKGTSAHLANAILERRGSVFWQEESFDHWIRSAAEGEKICRYIENNPVKAGLVKTARDWCWSSATSVAQALSPTGVSYSDDGHT